MSGPRQVEAEPVEDQAKVCPICSQAWEDHNLTRARTCARVLEEALSLGERRFITISAPKRRLPEGILRITK